jgi:hypothetical protein
MSVTITDRSASAFSRYHEAARKGVDAIANVMQREITRAHTSDYYRGGAFRDTVKVRKSIRRTVPVWEPDGWASTVGTNKMVALYWELGHHNTFTRRYERREIWVPTAAANVEAARAAFARVVKRIMDAT